MSDTSDNLIGTKLIINIDEAAKMIGVGKNTMLELAKREDFPAVKFNRKIIINKRQFIKWFDNLTSTGTNTIYTC